MAGIIECDDTIEELKRESAARPDMPDPYASGRPRGILTAGDRSYLLTGPDEGLSAKAEAQKRFKIRERATHSILDLTILLEHLEERDRVQVQDDIDPTDGIAFLVQRHLREIVTAPESAKSASAATREFHVKYFKQVLTNALTRSIEAEDFDDEYEVEVDVSIDISTVEPDYPDPVEIEEMVQAGEIKAEEIEEMYNEGHLNLHQFEQLVRNGRLYYLDDLTDEARQDLLAETPDFLDEDDEHES